MLQCCRFLLKPPFSSLLEWVRTGGKGVPIGFLRSGIWVQETTKALQTGDRLQRCHRRDRESHMKLWQHKKPFVLRDHSQLTTANKPRGSQTSLTPTLTRGPCYTLWDAPAKKAGWEGRLELRNKVKDHLQQLDWKEICGPVHLVTWIQTLVWPWSCCMFLYKPLTQRQENRVAVPGANFTSEGAVSVCCLLRTDGLCELAFSSRDQSPDLPHSWKGLSGSLHLSWIGIFPLPLQTPSKHAVIQTMHENVCGEECARLNTQGGKKGEHEKPDI